MVPAEKAIVHGRQARKEGNLAFAREQYAHAAKIYREHDDALAYAHTIRHIADIYVEEGNSLDAAPLYEEALELYRSNLTTRLLNLANTVRPYALLVERRGTDPILAKELWAEARSLYRSLQVEAGVAECDTHISRI